MGRSVRVDVCVLSSRVASGRSVRAEEAGLSPRVTSSRSGRAVLPSLSSRVPLGLSERVRSYSAANKLRPEALSRPVVTLPLVDSLWP